MAVPRNVCISLRSSDLRFILVESRRNVAVLHCLTNIFDKQSDFVSVKEETRTSKCIPYLIHEVGALVCVVGNYSVTASASRLNLSLLSARGVTRQPAQQGVVFLYCLPRCKLVINSGDKLHDVHCRYSM